MVLVLVIVVMFCVLGFSVCSMVWLCMWLSWWCMCLSRL